VVGAVFQHFLPYSLISRTDAHKAEGDRWFRILTQSLEDPARFKAYAPEQAVPKSLRFVLATLASSEPLVQVTLWEKPLARLRAFLDSLDEELTLPNWLQFVESTSPAARTEIAGILRYFETTISSVVARELGPKYELEPLSTGLVADVRGINDYVTNFFSNDIHYIGPMREEPRAVYSSEQALQANDVGIHGEHTAALLHYRNHQVIRHVPPSALSTLTNKSAVRSTTLGAAVTEWLAYIGVADGFETADKGQLGYEVKVKSNASTRFHDLPNVGFGVSQVLPIIVGSLLAEKGSVILLEQPELHLHPRLQARLSDFLLSLTFLDKQVICETHSRSLVDRLRYRIAADDSNRISDRLALYFLTRTPPIGTELRPLRINRYGKLQEWPEGFLDDDREAERIVQAAARKFEAEQDQS
jgi:predicted ATPase